MEPIDLADLPPALAGHVPYGSRVTFPPQGKTSNVAFFAERRGRIVVVKRCAHRVYLDWLRREQAALRALASRDLPIPRFIAYAEVETGGGEVGWLVMSHVAGSQLLGALADALPPAREALLRRLGELLRRLHAAPVPPELQPAEPWLSRQIVGSSRVDLQACKLEYSIVSPK